MTRVLVLDAGTSALKAVLFDEAGAVVGRSEADYGRAPGPHRQDPEAWWRAARRAVAELAPGGVDAIALSGTMENLIAVDADGRPVHDAILYSDPCGTEALAALGPALEAAGAGAILGNAPEPLMTAFKLRWLSGAAPGAFAAARWFLPGAKDALALRLTGRAVTDPTTASTTGLMDIATRDWSPALVEALGTPREKLPAILAAGETIGPLTSDAARDLGLDTDAPIPVINGCGDGGATTVGARCREAGDVSLYLGTTGWVARVVPDAGLTLNPAVYRLAHPDAGLIIEITPILAAGAAGNWVRDILDIPAGDRDRLLAEADRAPTDLLFLPYLAGERFPFFDADVRAAFIGLDATHRRGDLYYAVLEGVGLAIRANLDRLDPDGVSPVRIAGGGGTSAVWPQMLADLLERPVQVPPDPENATASGAFLVAAAYLGLTDQGLGQASLLAPRIARGGRGRRLAAAYEQGTAVARRFPPSHRR